MFANMYDNSPTSPDADTAAEAEEEKKTNEENNNNDGVKCYSSDMENGNTDYRKTESCHENSSGGSLVRHLLDHTTPRHLNYASPAAVRSLSGHLDERNHSLTLSRSLSHCSLPRRSVREPVKPERYNRLYLSDKEMFECTRCARRYSHLKSLNKHWKEKHVDDAMTNNLVAPTKITTSSFNEWCKMTELERSTQFYGGYMPPIQYPQFLSPLALSFSSVAPSFIGSRRWSYPNTWTSPPLEAGSSGMPVVPFAHGCDSLTNQTCVSSLQSNHNKYSAMSLPNSQHVSTSDILDLSNKSSRDSLHSDLQEAPIDLSIKGTSFASSDVETSIIDFSARDSTELIAATCSGISDVRSPAVAVTEVKCDEIQEDDELSIFFASGQFQADQLQSNSPLPRSWELGKLRYTDTYEATNKILVPHDRNRDDCQPLSVNTLSKGVLSPKLAAEVKVTDVTAKENIFTHPECSRRRKSSPRLRVTGSHSVNTLTEFDRESSLLVGGTVKGRLLCRKCKFEALSIQSFIKHSIMHRQSKSKIIGPITKQSISKKSKDGVPRAKLDFFSSVELCSSKEPDDSSSISSVEDDEQPSSEVGNPPNSTVSEISDGDSSSCRASGLGQNIRTTEAPELPPLFIYQRGRGLTTTEGKSGRGRSMRNRRLLKCKSCNYQTDSPTTLQRHEKHHGAQQLHKCPFCDYSLKQQNAINYHIFSAHNSDPFELADVAHVQEPSYAHRHFNAIDDSAMENRSPTEEYFEAAAVDLEPVALKSKAPAGSFLFTLVNLDVENDCEINGADSQPKKHSWEDVPCINVKKPYVLYGRGCQRGHRTCVRCGYSCLNPVKMSLHRLKHGDERYQCHLCPYRATMLKILTRHVKNCHSSVTSSSGQHSTPFCCTECPFMADSNSRIVSHARFHCESHQFKCSRCSFSSDREKVILKHNALHKGKHLPATMHCERCPFKTRSRQLHVVHMGGHLSVKRQHICRVCGFSTDVANVMLHHSVWHDG